MPKAEGFFFLAYPSVLWYNVYSMEIFRTKIRRFLL